MIITMMIEMLDENKVLRSRRIVLSRVPSSHDINEKINAFIQGVLTTSLTSATTGSRGSFLPIEQRNCPAMLAMAAFCRLFSSCSSMVVSMDVSMVAASEEFRGETASAETVMAVLLRFLGMVGDVYFGMQEAQVALGYGRANKSGDAAVSWRSLTKIDISLYRLFPPFPFEYSETSDYMYR